MVLDHKEIRNITTSIEGFFLSFLIFLSSIHPKFICLLMSESEMDGWRRKIKGME
jgi:hypothetical protein